jgi:hypothetical protein
MYRLFLSPDDLAWERFFQTHQCYCTEVRGRPQCRIVEIHLLLQRLRQMDRIYNLEMAVLDRNIHMGQQALQAHLVAHPGPDVDAEADLIGEGILNDIGRATVLLAATTQEKDQNQVRINRYQAWLQAHFFLPGPVLL